MYCDFFGLSLPPFNNSPDPRFFFGTPDHKEALASLLYAAKQRKGFVMITGEVGAGKTLLTRLLARRLDSRTDVAVVNNTNLHGRDLLATICRQFGMDPSAQDGVAELSSALEGYLVDQYRKDRIVLLIMDEAQNLPVEGFEQLRMISNLEAEDAKLIQIMILGQPELKGTFQRPELAQLRQRIFRSFHLAGLTPTETAEYIRHRLGIAEARNAERVFEERAVERIYEYSRGIPRAINQICDNAMLSAYAQGKDFITRDIIDEVMTDMLSMESSGPSEPIARTVGCADADGDPDATASRTPPPPAYPGPMAYPAPWAGGFVMPFAPPGAPNTRPARETERKLERRVDQAEEAERSLERRVDQAEEAERRFEKLVDRAESLIHKFEKICKELPENVNRLEQAHAQVTQTCKDAKEHGASLTDRTTRSGELCRLMEKIYRQTDDQLEVLRKETQEQLSQLREAVEEAGPLCLSIPAESERLAAMMRAHKAALKQVPRLSNDMKTLLENSQTQAQRLKGIIEAAQQFDVRRGRQPSATGTASGSSVNGELTDGRGATGTILPRDGLDARGRGRLARRLRESAGETSKGSDANVAEPTKP